MSKNKEIFIKLKVVKLCILNGFLCWKDPGGILLNCLLEDESKQTMKEFHKGDYGGHHYWKSMVNKILRASFYWTTMLYDVQKEVASCHECQIFEGKIMLLSLPLRPIFIEAPFQ